LVIRVDRKTQKNDANVRAFVNTVPNQTRRSDSLVVVKMMRAASGAAPAMWGPSIIGFGTHHYRYANGQQAEICRIGFSPRKQSLVFYLGHFPDRAKLLQKLGKCRVGSGGCIYVNRLQDVDLDVLQTIIGKAWRHRKREVA
jgi:Domain of unknown function (DU1801)